MRMFKRPSSTMTVEPEPTPWASLPAQLPPFVVGAAEDEIRMIVATALKTWAAQPDRPARIVVTISSQGADGQLRHDSFEFPDIVAADEAGVDLHRAFVGLISGHN